MIPTSTAACEVPIASSNDIWLSAVLRSIGDGVIACEADGRVVFMNGVAEQLTGWCQEEALHRPLSEIFRRVAEETREPIESPLDGIRQRGAIVGPHPRALLIARHGEEIAIESSGAPILDSEGALTGMALTFRDVTQRRRTERNLELLSDSGRALAESRDLKQTLQNIAQLCIRSFSDFCYFDLLREDGSIDRAVRIHRDPAQQAILQEASQMSIRREAYHPVNEALATGKGTLIERVTDDWLRKVAIDETHLRCIRELRFHTLLSVPVRDGHRNFGTLSFCRTVNPIPFHDADCDVAMELGYRIGAHLHNSQLSQAAHEARKTVRLEQEKLRDLFLQAPAPILMLSGPSHLITLANDQYVRLVRRESPADLVGKTIREGLPELAGQGFYELLDSVYQTGTPYYGREIPAAIENAQTGAVDSGYFNFVYQPTRNAAGEIDGIFNFVIEITEEVRARKEGEVRERLLERQSSELEAIYKTAPIGLALFDPVEFRYLRLNDTQARIVGLPAEEILGKTLTEIAPIEGLNEMFQQVAEGKPIQNALLEGQLPTQPGVQRYWTVNYFPVYGEDGAVQAITAASLEITAQKRAERALIQNEKITAVGRLASSIAHEINNPLEAVTNLLYLARISKEHAQVQEFLEAADRELRRISLIATQTLRFYRQSTRPQAIQCEALVDSVLTLNQGRLLNANIRVQTRPWVERPIVCFEGEIRQVLNNLVGNAVDAMPQGGCLSIRSAEGMDWKTGRPGLILTVADTGDGIPEPLRKQIFDPFFTTKGNNGTGLGLWISHEIVEKHQGSIRVRSCWRGAGDGTRSGTGGGTVFRMFLPFDAVLPDSIQLPPLSSPARS